MRVQLFATCLGDLAFPEAVADDVTPVLKSGRQEYLENVVGRYTV